MPWLFWPQNNGIRHGTICCLISAVFPNMGILPVFIIILGILGCRRVFSKDNHNMCSPSLMLLLWCDVDMCPLSCAGHLCSLFESGKSEICDHGKRGTVTFKAAL